MLILLLSSYALACAILIFVIYIMLRPMLFGAIYFPTTPGHIETIKELAHILPNDTVVDLGSGDGRILIAIAQSGAKAHGYEIDPFLVIRSRRAIRKAGLEDKAVVHWKSFWKADLSPYNVVIAYGFPHIMKALGKKLKKELSPSARVISNIFTFSDLAEVEEKNNVRLYTTRG